MLVTRSIISFFFVSLAINVTSALYEAVYLSKSTSEFSFVYDVKYSKRKENFVVKSRLKKVTVYCPRQEDSTSLGEWDHQQRHKVTLQPVCEKPAKAMVFKANEENQFVIGFLVYDPNFKSKHNFINIPKDHHPAGIIYFKFDTTIFRVKSIFYAILNGNFLKPEPQPGNDAIQYEKNEEMYDYELDSLYSQSSPFVKIPLAPAEDFFFQTWKTASRSNALTAPMWRQLTSQWKSLEVFIRKVAQVLEELLVTTGVRDDLMQLGKSEPVYLGDKTYPIPKYYWKAVTIAHFYDNKPYVYGILFIMHHNPAAFDETKICQEDIAPKNDWKFLQNGQQFESLMYACSINQDTASFIDQKLEEGEKYQDFNLRELSAVFRDQNGNKQLKTINVLDEMNKIGELEKNG